MGDVSEPSSEESLTTGSMVGDIQEVKGRVFATDREVLVERFGERQWTRLMDVLPLRIGALFDGLDDDGWYPESELRRLMWGVHAKLAGGDSEAFFELARALATARFGRYRMLDHITSSAFAMRKMPVFWSRQRRGPAEVSAEFKPDGRVWIRYDDFRYCREELYRQLLIAECQALAFAVDEADPEVDVVEWDRYSLTLAITLRLEASLG